MALEARSLCSATDEFQVMECSAIQDLYDAFGQKPATWGAGISAGTSPCEWDPLTLRCNALGRVMSMCARPPRLASRRLASRALCAFLSSRSCCGHH